MATKRGPASGVGEVEAPRPDGGTFTLVKCECWDCENEFWVYKGHEWNPRRCPYCEAVFTMHKLGRKGKWRDNRDGGILPEQPTG